MLEITEVLILLESDVSIKRERIKLNNNLGHIERARGKVLKKET